MKTHLFFGLLTVVLLIIVIGSRRQEAFTFDDVVGMAQAIAAGRRVSTAPVLPKGTEEKFHSVFQLRQPSKGVRRLRPAQEAPTLSTASGTHHEEAGRNRDSFPSVATE